MRQRTAYFKPIVDRGYGYSPGWLVSVYLGCSICSMSSPLRAEEKDECQDASTQRQATLCAQQTLAKAEEQLSALLASASARRTESASTLKKSQRQWLKYRDTNCTWKTAPSRGGTIFPLVWTLCLSRETELRNADLTEFLARPEGDQ